MECSDCLYLSGTRMLIHIQYHGSGIGYGLILLSLGTLFTIINKNNMNIGLLNEKETNNNYGHVYCLLFQIVSYYQIRLIRQCILLIIKMYVSHFYHYELANESDLRTIFDGIKTRKKSCAHFTLNILNF